MPKSLSDYVKIFEGTFAPEQCEALIERFEAAADLHDRKEAKDTYSFVQLNVSRHWPDVESQVAGVFMTSLQRYWRELGIGASWPAKPLAEDIRMKRYLPNGRDAFAPHVDVLDDADARRFVSAILYLNEPGGGETVFPGLELSVAPAPGRLVVFPPLWLFPHAGLPPRDRPKYILHAYLWYPAARADAPGYPR